MKIKQTQNEKVKSFAFSFDLNKGDSLKNILKLFGLHFVYLDMYDLYEKGDCIAKALEENLFENSYVYNIYKNKKNISVKIHIEKISFFLKLLQDLKCDFDEINIWSCDTNWEQHLEEINTPAPFYTFRKTNVVRNNAFYLNYKENNILIICDIELCQDISKESLNNMIH